MLFSIVVLSYNRPDQIERILVNLKKTSSSNFNLIIKDDCSPRQLEIQNVVEKYRSQLDFEIIFHKNDINLGYDQNLLDAFYIADSDYVFLLSDDDYVMGEFLGALSDLLSAREYKLYYVPYLNNGVLCRKKINHYEISRFHEVIYNSILFSGLIFHRVSVLQLPLDRSFLSNCIYTQVYLASLLAFNEGKFGEAPSNLLYLGGDGENFFGKNESAVNKEVLQDRSAIVANLRYQVFLLKVVEKIAQNTDPCILKRFLHHYNIRLIGYMARARSGGLESYLSLIKEISISNIDLKWYSKLSLVFFILIPRKLSSYVYTVSVRRFRKSG
jgi:glycosyltransferase involved in cell wall biosynthesis